MGKARFHYGNNSMVTYTLVKDDSHTPLTGEQAKSVIEQALAKPPVQFDRLCNDQGWIIQNKGQTLTLLKIYVS